MRRVQLIVSDHTARLTSSRWHHGTGFPNSGHFQAPSHTCTRHIQPDTCFVTFSSATGWLLLNAHSQTASLSTYSRTLVSMPLTSPTGTITSCSWNNHKLSNAFWFPEIGHLSRILNYLKSRVATVKNNRDIFL